MTAATSEVPASVSAQRRGLVLDGKLADLSTLQELYGIFSATFCTQSEKYGKLKLHIRKIEALHRVFFWHSVWSNPATTTFSF